MKPINKNWLTPFLKKVNGRLWYATTEKVYYLETLVDGFQEIGHTLEEVKNEIAYTMEQWEREEKNEKI